MGLIQSRPGEWMSDNFYKLFNVPLLFAKLVECIHGFELVFGQKVLKILLQTLIALKI